MRKRAVSISQKSAIATYISPDIPTHPQRGEERAGARVTQLILQKNSYMPQKSPIHRAKEPWKLHKRALCVAQKSAKSTFMSPYTHPYPPTEGSAHRDQTQLIMQNSPIHCPKEPYTSRKRALKIAQKSPMYCVKQRYSYIHITIHTYASPAVGRARRDETAHSTKELSHCAKKPYTLEKRALKTVQKSPMHCAKERYSYIPARPNQSCMFPYR